MVARGLGVARAASAHVGADKEEGRGEERETGSKSTRIGGTAGTRTVGEIERAEERRRILWALCITDIEVMRKRSGKSRVGAVESRRQ